MSDSILIRAGSDGAPITPVRQSDFDAWLATQPQRTQNLAQHADFSARPGEVLCAMDAEGHIEHVYWGLSDDLNPHPMSRAVNRLPAGEYVIEHEDAAVRAALIAAWGFGGYRFERYKKSSKPRPVLHVQDAEMQGLTLRRVMATAMVRDLINTPADDMGPTELSDFCRDFARTHRARFHETVGDDLLAHNFPAIHLVGRASHKAPRLIEMNWGEDSAPLVCLVGKGVCFDTGGNNMKDATGMKLMKKDMGGAAHVLGLADMIMRSELPVRLKVLIPAVENAVAGNAYRQGDVVVTRSGQSVEIGHTDAEGRVILCDALSYACEHEPTLVIDFATLTGAARVALGPDLPPLFCNDDDVLKNLHESSWRCHDPLWPMPLYRPYNKYIKPKIADLSNAASIPQAGCITAALYLQHFIEVHTPWIHIDTFGWNFGSRTGGHAGGEALGMHAVYDWLSRKHPPTLKRGTA